MLTQAIPLCITHNPPYRGTLSDLGHILVLQTKTQQAPPLVSIGDQKPQTLPTAMCHSTELQVDMAGGEITMPSLQDLGLQILDTE